MNAPLVRLSAIIVLALLATFTPRLPAADAQKSDSELLTRYFWVPSSLLKGVGGSEAAEENLPMILDGLEDNAVTRANNARKFLEESGVTFPLGAAAIFYNQAALLGVKNTVENIRKVAEIILLADDPEPRLAFIEVRVMEYAVDVEEKLAGRGTFAELEAKLGESVKTVCVASVLATSGQRATGRLDSGSARTNAAPKRDAKTKAAVEESETWPPPTGVQRALLEVEPTLMPGLIRGEEKAAVQVSFRYAAPAGSGQPAMRAEVASNFSINDGCLLVVKTFSVSDPANKHPAPRRYAILASFKKISAEGKTAEQIREEIARKLKKPKQQ